MAVDVSVDEQHQDNAPVITLYMHHVGCLLCISIMLDACYDQLDHVYVYASCQMLVTIRWIIYLCMYKVDTLYDQVDHV